MKKMRRMVAGLLAIGMAFALTACGGKEQTVTYRMETEDSGLKMVDTMTLTAKGDKVEKLSETIEIDMSSLEEEQTTQINAAYDAMVEQYKAVDGVECTGEAGEGKYTIKIDVDTTGDAIKTLSEQGLMEVEGDASGISLKKTGTALEGNGYSKVE
jgi:uncharacterized lipoprotein YehR (DUF1307 family)